MLTALIVGLVGSACGWVGFAWDSTTYFGPLSRQELYGPETRGLAPLWSPDGNHVAVIIKREHNVWHGYSVPTSGGVLHRLSAATPESMHGSLTMSAGGRLAYVDYWYEPRQGFVRQGTGPHHATIVTTNFDATDRVELEVPSASYVYALAWWPGPDLLIARVFSEQDREINGLYTVGADGKLARFDGPGLGDASLRYVRFPVFSPNGEHIAYLQYEHESRPPGPQRRAVIERVDGLGSPVQAPFAKSPLDTSAIAWAPDGQSVLFATMKQPEGEHHCGDETDTTIWRLSVDGSEIEPVAELPSTGGVYSVLPSPRGDHILFLHPCGEGLNVLTEGEVHTLPTVCCVHKRHFAASWSPDGTRIAVVDQRQDKQQRIPALQVMNPDGSQVTTLIYRETDGSLTPGLEQSKIIKENHAETN
ncbi:MAG: hypothetical protein OXF79_20985 [Chloroflexi bacterium]|nr:hypothetical protein [Chloroflexota bacterium]